MPYIGGDWYSSTQSYQDGLSQMVQRSLAGITPAITEDNPYLHLADCKCEVHKMLKGEKHSVKAGVLHNYTFRPRQWRLRELKEGDPFGYHLGVELETDNYFHDREGRLRYSPLTPKQATELRRPKQLWIAKRDGSVSGPEFVSHPATPAFWASKRKELDGMFRSLIHSGFRSHDNDAAGMHVNISRTAFKDEAHFHRFLVLIYRNPRLQMQLSQRTRSSAGEWAGFNRTMEKCAEDASRVYGTFTQHVWRWDRGYVDIPGNGREVRTETPRYTALNIPYGQPRFEFRLPRGTLRVDRFFKNIEWVTAMVEYSRETKAVTKMQAKSWLAYVEENGRKYPNLLAFAASKPSIARS